MTRRSLLSLPLLLAATLALNIAGCEKLCKALQRAAPVVDQVLGYADLAAPYLPPNLRSGYAVVRNGLEGTIALGLSACGGQADRAKLEAAVGAEVAYLEWFRDHRAEVEAAMRAHPVAGELRGLAPDPVAVGRTLEDLRAVAR